MHCGFKLNMGLTILLAITVAGSVLSSPLDRFKNRGEVKSQSKEVHVVPVQTVMETRELMARENVTHYMATLEDLTTATNTLDQIIISRGYLTSADLSAYPTKTYVDGEISNLATAAATSIAQSTNNLDKAIINRGYSTTNWVSEELASLASAVDETKADKATTLAGYGITDAKIQDGVITLGGNTITPLTQHQSLAAYSTTAQMNTAIQNATNGVYTTLNTAKADKATTLAGYGITDAKIQDGVITLGGNTITPLTQHQSLDAYSTTEQMNTAIQTATGNMKSSIQGEMSVVAGTGANADKTTITLKTGTSATVLTSHQSLASYSTTEQMNTAIQTATGNLKTSIQGEMSIVPGTGENADKTTITLKNGTSASVLTAHQSLNGYAKLNDAQQSGTFYATSLIATDVSATGNVSLGAANKSINVLGNLVITGTDNRKWQLGVDETGTLFITLIND